MFLLLEAEKNSNIVNDSHTNTVEGAAISKTSHLSFEMTLMLRPNKGHTRACCSRLSANFVL